MGLGPAGVDRVPALCLWGGCALSSGLRASRVGHVGDHLHCAPGPGSPVWLGQKGSSEGQLAREPPERGQPLRAGRWAWMAS